MSWMAKLYETYEAGMELELASDQKPMPISHTLQNAHINIVIDGNGNFKRASVLEKTQVVLPATEKSAGRSSGEAPHPLADKIQYIAKDYAAFGGKKKNYFAGYKSQLEKWCNSSFSNPMAIAIYEYIKHGQVVADLIANKILYVDATNQFLMNWPYDVTDEQPVPLIYRVLPKEKGNVEFGSALVCWSVEVQGILACETWKDLDLQQSWVDFDAMSGGVKGVCYVTGKEQYLAQNHPAKLRHTGDKAKLISANDLSGFTFKGRFTDTKASIKAHGGQAVGLSLEVTQKAHNALRWLISRQGYRNGDQVYVSWAVSNKEIPQPVTSSLELFDAAPSLREETSPEQVHGVNHGLDLGSSFANSLTKYMAGYRTKLDPNEQIVIMGLDSATPGRMGIIYYRELLASEFLDRLQSWHSDFAWPQRHTKEYTDPNGKKKLKKKTIWPISSPVPRIIAEAAFGDVLKSNDTLKKSIMERILPCIVDGRPFPEDVMNSAVRRASNPNSCDKWEWQRNVGVACALFKGFYLRHPEFEKRRKYKMALEEDRTTRDYLYGRLLAIAERIEEIAQGVGGEKRPTNASRLMQRFADRPFSTWRNIELSLQPYMQRLQGTRAGFLTNSKRELDIINALFKAGDFTSDNSLSGEFLLGYHCQKQDWRNKKSTDTEVK